jgi:hypothetical protein
LGRTRGGCAFHAVAVAGLGVILAARPAHAYRPFDETDASVAELHTIELELGPVGYLHQPGSDSYLPGFIFNYGAVNRIELVFDAHNSFLFGGPQVEARRRQLESELLIKGVLREGSLQGGAGPSLAAEAGVILPTFPAAGGLGASLAFIGSQRWPALTVDLNLEGDRTRDDSWAFIAGTIVEGPDTWTVRPAAEFFVAREDGLPTTVSGLAAAIWRWRPNLSFDAAVRLARQDDQRVVELRAGLTWVLGT